MLLFQIVAGIGASVYHSAGMALASDIAPRKRIGRFMAVQGVGGTLGVAVAPFVVSFLGALLGWRKAVQGVAVVALPFLLCIWWFLRLFYLFLKVPLVIEKRIMSIFKGKA